MNLPAETTRALKELERVTGGGVTPQRFIFRDVPIPCTPNTLGEGAEFEIGGKLVTASLTLYVRRSHWLTWGDQTVTVGSEEFTLGESGERPIVGQNIEFRDRTYKIHLVRVAPDDSHLVFICADPKSHR